MNSERNKECTELSAEILKNFELSEIPISSIILKCLRLCRLLGDEDGILLFTYEASGYPTGPNGMPPDSWRISKISGRRYFVKEKNGDEEQVEYAKLTLIAEMEELVASQKIRLSSARDPNISLSSSNPNQVVLAPSGNTAERDGIVSSIRNSQKWIKIISGNLYDYILRIYNKLSYGNIIEDTFTRARLAVNSKLVAMCPQSMEKFVSVYDNMDSNNPEDWANAVHSCRRILTDLADVLYPPRREPITVGGKLVKVGQEQYVNRLVQFIADKAGSKTYRDVVGADLSSIGMRLDAIYEASCKGTHADITKDEASRYIIHTYLLVSDIVALV